MWAPETAAGGMWAPSHWIRSAFIIDDATAAGVMAILRVRQGRRMHMRLQSKLPVTFGSFQCFANLRNEEWRELLASLLHSNECRALQARVTFLHTDMKRCAVQLQQNMFVLFVYALPGVGIAMALAVCFCLCASQACMTVTCHSECINACQSVSP